MCTRTPAEEGQAGAGPPPRGLRPRRGGLDESQVKGVGDGAPCVLVAWA